MEFFTFDWISNPQIWLSLLTLTALEIVLGIDNIVFIAILTNRLPPEQRPRCYFSYVVIPASRALPAYRTSWPSWN